MTKGAATASTPVLCEGATAVKTAIDALILAGLNVGTAAGDNYDSIQIIPVSGRDQAWIVFKIAFVAV